MSYLLDTNVCIFALKGHLAVVANLGRRSPDELAVSTITLAELWFGARKSRDPARARRLQDAFLEPIAVLDFTAEAAEHYADIRFELEAKGRPIGERDELIAAVARAAGRTLVTNNGREFGRISGLRLADWTRGEG